MHAQAFEQPLGRVVSIRGSNASIGILEPRPDNDENARITVGKFVSIRTGQLTLIGTVTEVGLQEATCSRRRRCPDADDRCRSSLGRQPRRQAATPPSS